MDLISVADPDPGSKALLTPGSVMGKKSWIILPNIYNQFLGVKNTYILWCVPDPVSF